jgi:hypothetical protein
VRNFQLAKTHANSDLIEKIDRLSDKRAKRSDDKLRLANLQDQADKGKSRRQRMRHLNAVQRKKQLRYDALRAMRRSPLIKGLFKLMLGGAKAPEAGGRGAPPKASRFESVVLSKLKPHILAGPEVPEGVFFECLATLSMVDLASKRALAVLAFLRAALQVPDDRYRAWLTERSLLHYYQPAPAVGSFSAAPRKCCCFACARHCCRWTNAVPP